NPLKRLSRKASHNFVSAFVACWRSRRLIRTLLVLVHAWRLPLTRLARWALATLSLLRGEREKPAAFAEQKCFHQNCHWCAFKAVVRAKNDTRTTSSRTPPDARASRSCCRGRRRPACGTNRN